MALVSRLIKGLNALRVNKWLNLWTMYYYIDIIRSRISVYLSIAARCSRTLLNCVNDSVSTLYRQNTEADLLRWREAILLQSNTSMFISIVYNDKKHSKHGLINIILHIYWIIYDIIVIV